MDSRIAYDERHFFSERLKASLEAAKVPTQPGQFARAYNARADGASITVHAARKWLNGEAIPTHEKLVILSIWLGVNAGWLRFGEPEDDIFGVGVVPEASVSTPALALLNDIMSLPESPRRIIRTIVDAFLAEFPIAANQSPVTRNDC
jgi:transcriptional regulator with XRE-family HTH domain